MPKHYRNLTRRDLIKLCAVGLVMPIMGWSAAGVAQELTPITRPIPTTGERLPVIGMGTWLTFDVATDGWLLTRRCEVLRAFFERGGALVDSSPMYGKAEEAAWLAIRKKSCFPPPKSGPGADASASIRWRIHAAYGE
jgi:hypothetical protein